MGWTSTAYRKLLQKLLPSGRAFNRDPGSTLTEFLTGAAQELARLDTKFFDLWEERDTRTANELLDEHEEDLGLPDDCLPREETLAARRAAAHTRLTTVGGLDVQYYIDLASTLGYTITIDQFTPFWAGIGAAGDPCGPLENMFYWRVNIYYDLTDPLPGTDLQCLLEKLAPAHAVILFRNVGPGFDSGFSSGFDSMPSLGLEGGFDRGFDAGFEVRWGGGFEFDGFSSGFDKIS